MMRLKKRGKYHLDSQKRHKRRGKKKGRTTESGEKKSITGQAYGIAICTAKRQETSRTT